MFLVSELHPSSSLATPEVFRSLPQHSACVRTLINQRQTRALVQQQALYSPHGPLKRSYISLFHHRFTRALERAEGPT